MRDKFSFSDYESRSLILGIILALQSKNVRDFPQVVEFLELTWKDKPEDLINLHTSFHRAIKNLEELFGKEFFKEGK